MASPASIAAVRPGLEYAAAAVIIAHRRAAGPARKRRVGRYTESAGDSYRSPESLPEGSSGNKCYILSRKDLRGPGKSTVPCTTRIVARFTIRSPRKPSGPADDRVGRLDPDGCPGPITQAPLGCKDTPRSRPSEHGSGQPRCAKLPSGRTPAGRHRVRGGRYIRISSRFNPIILVDRMSYSWTTLSPKLRSAPVRLAEMPIWQPKGAIAHSGAGSMRDAAFP